MTEKIAEEQGTTPVVPIATNSDNDILSFLEKHNPSQSPIVEKFLRAFYANQRGTCLQMLDEGELVIYDKAYLKEEGRKMRTALSEQYKGLFMGRIKSLSIERDTYAQFYYSVLDVVAQTPSLMAFAKKQIEAFTKLMNKAAKRPWKEPANWLFVTDVLMGLVSLFARKKTRNLISQYLKKVDFKSPFLLMMDQENFPEKFFSLKPYIEKVDAAGRLYAQKREAWEISKCAGDTYEERRANWLAKKEAEKAKQQELNQA